MQQVGTIFEWAGKVFLVIGGLIFVSILIVVLFNGSWPDFLEPVRSRFGIINSFLGPFTFIAELAVFLGPGWIVFWLGQQMKQQNK